MTMTDEAGFTPEQLQVVEETRSCEAEHLATAAQQVRHGHAAPTVSTALAMATVRFTVEQIGPAAAVRLLQQLPMLAELVFAEQPERAQ